MKTCCPVACGQWVSHLRAAAPFYLLVARCCLSIGTDEFTVSASSSQICARQLNMLLTGVWGEVGLRQLTEPRPVASLAVAAFQIY